MSRLVMTRFGFVVLCVLSACAKRVTPPAAQSVEVAGVNATWRDYAGEKINVCEVDPQTLASELEAMNALLLKFVEQTSGGMEGAWSAEQAQLLEDGTKTLKPAVDAHDAAVRASLRCSFDPKLNMRDIQRKGEELVKQTNKRLGDAELLEYAKTSVALAKWKDRQPEEQRSAREQWCPPKPKRGSPDIFYVFSDENGQVAYLFCDGSKVTSVEGEKPQYVSPDSKKVPARPYLDAAASYPPEEIQKAPRLPKKEPPPEETAAEGEAAEAEKKTGEE